VDVEQVTTNVRGIAEGFAADRAERQRRRELDRADFDALAEAGYLLTGVPAEQGGLFASVAESTRGISGILRALAQGDPSVALVSSMHPAVQSFWHATPSVEGAEGEAWAAQRSAVAELAKSGVWFGTITSEPGSGGDVANTRSAATRDGEGGWRISGQKHFGSGSGISGRMLTAAVPEGEEAPDWFLLDTSGGWGDGTGMRLVAPWDGFGMAATQSHGFEFDGFPATRFAATGRMQALSDAAAPLVVACFMGVVLGVVESAMETAREQLGRRASLRAYEQVEWANAEQDAFLLEQAYEGVLRRVESGEPALRTALIAKTAGARLAEDCVRRIGRVLGGGTFSRHAPFGYWFEDVRALGFLRPPWGLAYDGLIASAFEK
jgi:alkylation response protein AidB-like acyl-CoA dehydrogenase